MLAGNIVVTTSRLTDEERRTFRRARARDALEVALAHDVVAMIVHPSNPLRALSIDQLDAVWSSTRNRGARDAASTWGDLGLEGDWARRAIRPCGQGWETGATQLVRLRVTDDGLFRDGFEERKDDEAVVAAVAADPGAIGYVRLGALTGKVRALAVRTGDGEAVAPSLATARSGAYPIALTIRMQVGCHPRTGAGAAARRFLEWIYSDDGRSVAGHAGYGALDAGSATMELDRFRAQERTVPTRGIIRFESDQDLREYVEAWADAFQATRPDAGIGFEFDDPGEDRVLVEFPSVAMRLTRESLGVASRRRLGHDAGLVLMNLTCGFEAAIVVVHRDNPIQSIDEAGLRAVWAATPLTTAGRPVRTWGELDLGDEWRNRPVLPFTRPQGAAHELFRDLVLKGGRCRDGAWLVAEDETVGALVARERGAVGIIGPGELRANLRGIPIRTDAGEVVEATRASIARGRYPLARPVWLVVAKHTDRPLPPIAAQVLRYIFSDAGRAVLDRRDFVVADGRLAAQQLAKAGLIAGR